MSGLATWLVGLQLAGVAVLVLAAAARRCARGQSAELRRLLGGLAALTLLVLPALRFGLAPPALAIPDPLAAIVVGVWLAGVAALVLGHGLSLRRAHRLRRDAAQLLDARWSSTLAEFDAEATEVRVTDELDGPCVVGCLDPAILLPRSMLDVPADERRSILAHELAHIARADVLVLHAAAAARALYWLTPLAWRALRALRSDIEAAADDAVLEAGVSSTSYATQLVALARAQLDRAGRLTSSTLRPRVEAILDPTRRRGSLALAPRPSLALARMLTAALVLASLATACEARTAEPERARCAPPTCTSP